MIEIRNISMQYGSTVALSNVSFSVNEGEILGILGPNGAGKSTLMKILTTFIYPCGGSASVGGFDILQQPLAVREIVGYLPENVPLYLDMRVDEYLTFVAQARGLTGERLKNRLEWVKKTCGIREVWKHVIVELSKGYRQRVGLAQALIHDPKVLILDEPTTGLDPLQIISIRKLIKELAKAKTIIISTHILQEVEATADRIVIINQGSIIASGTKRELDENSRKFRSHVLTIKERKEVVEKALGGLPSVKDCSLLEETPDGWVMFIVRSSIDNISISDEIDQLIKKQGWPVRSLYEQRYTLEDTFISLLSKQAETVDR